MSVLEREESLDRLLARLQPQLRATLSRFSIPPAEAEPLLRDLFLTLAYKRESIASPDRWLLNTLRYQCTVFWRRKRWELFSNLDDAVRESLGDGLAGSEEKQRLRDELEGVIATMPVSCRGFLRSRYGLCERTAETGGPDDRLRNAELPRETDGGALLARETGDRERCLTAFGQRLLDLGLVNSAPSTPPN